MNNNNIILKITEEEKQKLISEINAIKNNAKIIRKITEKNAVIILNKNACDILEKQGISLNGKKYFSKNSTPLLYNTLNNIIIKNKDIFAIIEK